MSGPPGSGKTLLARALPSVLPAMTLDEALETTKIYSISGMLPNDRPLVPRSADHQNHDRGEHFWFAGVDCGATGEVESGRISGSVRGNRHHRCVHGGSRLAIPRGWLTWLSRIAAVSAVANLFIIYLSEFFPSVRAPVTMAGVLMILIGFLALLNYRGVTGGNRLSIFLPLRKWLCWHFSS